MQSIPLDANLAGVGGSPKALFQLFYYRLGENYFNTMSKMLEEGSIENATAALIALACPDKTMQLKLLKMYSDIKDGKDEDTKTIGGNSIVTASVLTIGELTIYLNSVLEFTEKSSAGFL